MRNSAIAASGLRKAYGDKIVLDGIDLDVPVGTGIRQFAEYQPFTPIIETLRGLLNGTPSAGDAIAAVAWCAGIALVGYAWPLSTFKKRA